MEAVETGEWPIFENYIRSTKILNIQISKEVHDIFRCHVQL